MAFDGNFLDDTSHEQISEKILSWMMDEFIHSPKPTLPLSTTCDEILSWTIETWNMSFSVGHTTLQFTNTIEQDN